MGANTFVTSNYFGKYLSPGSWFKFISCLTQWPVWSQLTSDFYIFQAFWLHQDVTSKTACGPKIEHMHCPPSKPIVRNVITKDRIVKILTFFANRFVTSVNYLWQTEKTHTKVQWVQILALVCSWARKILHVSTKIKILYILLSPVEGYFHQYHVYWTVMMRL